MGMERHEEDVGAADVDWTRSRARMYMGTLLP